MIMRELIEVAKEIGSLGSSNPIINYFYKIRKNGKLNKIKSIIDELPDIPSDDDIVFFSSVFPIFSGLDIDGDAYIFKNNVTMVVNMMKSDVVFKVHYLDGDEHNVCNMRVDLHSRKILYNMPPDGVPLYYCQDPCTVIAKRYVGEAIKSGLKMICEDCIIGGNKNVYRNK